MTQTTHNKLAPVNAVQTISMFASSMVGIFIPVYLLTLGYSLQIVMVFFLIQDTAKFLATQLTGYLSARVPMKALMLVRIPILILYLALLINSKHHQSPLVLIAVLGGINTAMYWIPLNIFFATGTESNQTGKQVGTFLALPQLFNLGAPLLSGIIAASLGFNWVFTIAAVLFALSAIPMARIAPYQAPLNFNLAKFRQLFGHYQRYFWLEFVENIQEELDGVIWPLAVFLLVKSTVQTGLAGTLIGAGSAAFTYLVGRRTDRSDKFRLLHLGAAAMLILWLLRLGPITPLIAFAISATAGFAGALISVPFNTIIYGLAKVENTREFIMFREYPVAMARILVYSTGILVATNFTHLFWLAILAYFAFIVMPRFNLKGTPLGSS